MSLNNDDELDEAEDKGETIDMIEGTKISLSFIIPKEAMKASYDSFVAFAEVIADNFKRQFKDAAVDQWFANQPLYNGDTKDGSL